MARSKLQQQHQNSKKPAATPKIAKSKAAIAAANKEASAAAAQTKEKRVFRFRLNTKIARDIRYQQKRSHGADLWLEPIIRALRAKLPHDFRVSDQAKPAIREVVYSHLMEKMINSSRLLNFRDRKKLTKRIWRFQNIFSQGHNFLPATITAE